MRPDFIFAPQNLYVLISQLAPKLKKKSVKVFNCGNIVDIWGAKNFIERHQVDTLPKLY